MSKHNRWTRALAALFVISLAGLSAPSGASEPTLLAQSDRAARTAVSSRDDPCILYTYDTNGNRLSQLILASGSPAAPTWGTGVWGCFKWSP